MSARDFALSTGMRSIVELRLQPPVRIERSIVTLTVDDPRALHQLGERLGALMADMWLDGKLDIG
jgi:hypothetical protein